MITKKRIKAQAWPFEASGRSRTPQHSKESFLPLACIVSEEQKTFNYRVFDEDMKVQFKTTNKYRIFWPITRG